MALQKCLFFFLPVIALSRRPLPGSGKETHGNYYFRLVKQSKVPCGKNKDFSPAKIRTVNVSNLSRICWLQEGWCRPMGLHSWSQPSQPPWHWLYADYCRVNDMERGNFFFILQNLLNTIIPHLICHYSSQHRKNIFLNWHINAFCKKKKTKQNKIMNIMVNIWLILIIKYCWVCGKLQADCLFLLLLQL